MNLIKQNRILIFRTFIWLLIVQNFFIVPVADAQLALGKEKYLGNVAGSSVFSNFMTFWNQITPENGGKWGSVEATKNVMSWSNLDAVYNYSKSKGIPVRFHTLVWGQQQPSWISGLSQDEQKAQVEEWIHLAAARYPNLDFIDVVNEPLHAVPSYSPALGGTGSSGWDWVIWCFEKARYYFPNAKLHINDYNILSSGTNVQNYTVIINLLKAKGLIDGIGCQGHFLESTSASTIRTNLNNLAKLGLPVYITEFDLNIPDDAQQLAKYMEIFPVLWEHTAVKGITLWGYRQGSIWRTDAYLLRSDNSERPAMTWLKNYIQGTTGMPPLSEGTITIFPNPAVDYVNIQRAEGYLLKVYDVLGRIVHTVQIPEQLTRIDISAFPKGILLFKLQSNNEEKTFKISHK